MKKYDIHNHTQFSPCSSLRPEILLKTAKKRGLNGIGITDHSTIKGGLAVKKLNRDKDFEVIVGSEIHTDLGDILALYISKDIKSVDFYSAAEEIKSQNGLIVIPHAFRRTLVNDHKFKFTSKEIKKYIDAIECLNARMLFDADNKKAQELARKWKIAMTGGSDAHFKFEVATAYTLFEGDFRSALRKRKTMYAGRVRLGALGGVMSFIRKKFL